MSTVLVVAPILISSWPAISVAVSAAIATMGFAAVQEASHHSTSDESRNREVIDVEDSEILQDSVGTDEQIVVRRGSVTATFLRDERGGLKICMEGKGVSKAELRNIGEELLGRVTQQYAYHRIVTELKSRNMTIVEEQITESESVKIRVRNW